MQFSSPPRPSGTTLFAVLAITVLVLGAPLLINSLIPSRSGTDTAQVELAGDQADWHIPITLSEPDGRSFELHCEENTEDPLAVRWDCADTSISSTITRTTDDPVLGLQRMVRAMRLGPLPHDLPVVAYAVDSRSVSKAYLMVGTDFFAFSLEGAGDYDGNTMVAVISGDYWYDTGAYVWNSATGEPLMEQPEPDSVVYGARYIDTIYPLPPPYDLDEFVHALVPAEQRELQQS